MTKLYVAGPMAGKEDHGIPAFERAAKALRDRGFDVVSPAELTLAEFGTVEEARKATWEHHMKRDIAALVFCDGLAMLNGWQDSRGATLERKIAMTLDIRVMSLEQWLV